MSGGQEVPGSNPGTPTTKTARRAGICGPIVAQTVDGNGLALFRGLQVMDIGACLRGAVGPTAMPSAATSRRLSGRPRCSPSWPPRRPAERSTARSGRAPKRVSAETARSLVLVGTCGHSRASATSHVAYRHGICIRFVPAKFAGMLNPGNNTSRFAGLLAGSPLTHSNR